MHAILRDRFRFQKEACSEAQAHHLSRDRIGCGRAVDRSAADRADTNDNGPGRDNGTATADDARHVSVRANQSGRSADRVERNHGDPGELDEPTRPERADTRG